MPLSRTAKTCRVNGTAVPGSGTAAFAPIAVSAAKTTTANARGRLRSTRAARVSDDIVVFAVIIVSIK
jgi:hypothetical protein